MFLFYKCITIFVSPLDIIAHSIIGVYRQFSQYKVSKFQTKNESYEASTFYLLLYNYFDNTLHYRKQSFSMIWGRPVRPGQLALFVNLNRLELSN